MGQNIISNNGTLRTPNSTAYQTQIILFPSQSVTCVLYLFGWVELTGETCNVEYIYTDSNGTVHTITASTSSFGAVPLFASPQYFQPQTGTSVQVGIKSTNGNYVDVNYTLLQIYPV